MQSGFVQQIGSLQQFGCAALAGTCGRCALRGIGEYVCQGGMRSPCVVHDEVVEEPPLQGVGASVSFLAQSLKELARVQESLFLLLQERVVLLLYPAQLGFHKLAFRNEALLLAHGQPPLCDFFPDAVAVCLGAFHLLPVGFHGGGTCFLQCVNLLASSLHLSAFLYLLDLSVDVGDACLFLLEMAVGLEEVEHRRHEERPVVAVGQQSGKGGEESP